MLGVTPYEMLLQGGGREGRSGVRRAPDAFALGHQRLNIVTRSSPTGTQFLQAVGAAEASLYFEKFPKALEQARKAPLGDTVATHRDEIVYVSGGDGSTSEGEFFEALNAACLQEAAGAFSDRGQRLRDFRSGGSADGGRKHFAAGANFPHLHVEECDGTDPLESYAVLRRAVEHCRARKGPALVHAHVTRPYSHSLSDDEKLYKTRGGARGGGAARSLSEIRLFLVREGILDESEIEALEAEVDREVVEATDRALAAELPARESIYEWVYSPDVDPTSRRFRSRRRNLRAIRRPWWKWFPPRCRTKWRATSASWSSAKTWPIAAAKRI